MSEGATTWLHRPESAELPAEILELRNFALRRSHLRVPNPEYETLGR